MKKEWLVQLMALLIFYLDNITSVEHEGLIFSEKPGVALAYVLYEALLFLIVNYVLIPRFFYTKKYFLFFVTLIGTIILFGVVEEGVVEQILSNRQARQGSARPPAPAARCIDGAESTGRAQQFRYR